MFKFLPSDPIKLFAEWFQEAKNTIVVNPDAAALATSTLNGKPSVRIILIKQFDERGFVFYTNFTSRKANELLENPQGALCCYWSSLNKQVRIEGKVIPVSEAEADHYFATRPRESKVVAWASKQSRPMPNINELDERFQEYTEKFRGSDVPRPNFWSGFRLVPETIEFWHEGAHRLHQRVLYAKGNNNEWDHYYLYP